MSTQPIVMVEARKDGGWNVSVAHFKGTGVRVWQRIAGTMEELREHLETASVVRFNEEHKGVIRLQVTAKPPIVRRGGQVLNPETVLARRLMDG